jgi:trehalose-6-phosphate synthase
VIAHGDHRTKPSHFDPAVLSAFAGVAAAIEKAFSVNPQV